MCRTVKTGLLALKFVSTVLGGGKIKVAAVDGAPTNNPLNALRLRLRTMPRCLAYWSGPRRL